jgi:hypothetical protein
VLPIRLSNDQRKGEVFASFHWTDRFTSAGPIDVVVGAATDPISGQPELKATPVRVAPVTPRWHGLLLRGSEQVPHGPYYWARVPLERGHAFTLVGWEALPSDRGASRRSAGGGTGDLRRSGARHLPLCQRNRKSLGRLPVHCEQAVFAAVA